MIADVAGKSVPRRCLMATLQASLRTHCPRALPLSRSAARLNRYACAHSLDGRRFTTAVTWRVRPGHAASFAYVNAGHNSPIFAALRAAGDGWTSGGLPLGIQSTVKLIKALGGTERRATALSCLPMAWLKPSIPPARSSAMTAWRIGHRNCFRPSRKQSLQFLMQSVETLCRRNPPVRRHHLPGFPLQ